LTLNTIALTTAPQGGLENMPVHLI
jgi:hypothetical protein